MLKDNDTFIIFTSLCVKIEIMLYKLSYVLNT